MGSDSAYPQSLWASAPFWVGVATAFSAETTFRFTAGVVGEREGKGGGCLSEGVCVVGVCRECVSVWW